MIEHQQHRSVEAYPPFDWKILCIKKINVLQNFRINLYYIVVKLRLVYWSFLPNKLEIVDPLPSAVRLRWATLSPIWNKTSLFFTIRRKSSISAFGSVLKLFLTINSNCFLPICVSQKECVNRPYLIQIYRSIMHITLGTNLEFTRRIEKIYIFEMISINIFF